MSVIIGVQQCIRASALHSHYILIMIWLFITAIPFYIKKYFNIGWQLQHIHIKIKLNKDYMHVHFTGKYQIPQINGKTWIDAIYSGRAARMVQRKLHQICVIHVHSLMLCRESRPSSPARQISVEDRTPQTGSRLTRSSSTSMGSHGNPYIDRRESMWPFRAELVQCQKCRAMYVNPNHRLRGSIPCSSKVAVVVQTSSLAAQGGMINDK